MRQAKVFAMVRNQDRSGNYAIDVQYICNIDPMDLLPTITDVANFASWDWTLESCRLVEETSSTSCVVHSVFKKSPGNTVAQRDYVYAMQWHASETDVVSFSSVTHERVPPRAGIVRGYAPALCVAALKLAINSRITAGTWRIASQPSAGERVSLFSLQLQYNPLGSEDAAVTDKVNEIVAITAGNNLIKLEKLCMQRKMSNMRLPRGRHSELPMGVEALMSKPGKPHIGVGAPASDGSDSDIVPATSVGGGGGDVANASGRPRRRSISDARTRFEFRRFEDQNK